MFMRSKIQGIVKGCWRLIEVYLFFIVSVFGGHIVAKNILSHTSKAKDKSVERRIYLLSKSVLSSSELHLSPSGMLCQAARSMTAGHTVLTKKESGDSDPIVAQKEFCSQLDVQGGFALSESPFITALEFYQLLHIVTDAPISPLETRLPQQMTLLQTPLLI